MELNLVERAFRELLFSKSYLCANHLAPSITRLQNDIQNVELSMIAMREEQEKEITQLDGLTQDFDGFMKMLRDGSLSASKRKQLISLFEETFGPVEDFKGLDTQCFECKEETLGDEKPSIQCDECSSFYHLSCLDPPLKRVPKGCVWVCEECDEASESETAE